MSYWRWKKLVNHYQQGLCNPFSKISYNLLLLNLLNLDIEGSMSQENCQDNSWSNTHVLDLPSGNHCCKQTPTKLGYSRLNHGLYRCLFLKKYSIPISLVWTMIKLKSIQFLTMLKELGSQKELNMCKC
jgi:hypothetical protein